MLTVLLAIALVLGREGLMVTLALLFCSLALYICVFKPWLANSLTGYDSLRKIDSGIGKTAQYVKWLLHKHDSPSSNL